MMTTGQVYALRDGDGWWYYLPEAAGHGIIQRVLGRSGAGDEWEMQPGQRKGWWLSKSEAIEAHVVKRTPAPVVCYKRQSAGEAMAHVLPESVTPEEYRERSGGSDADDEVEPLTLLYRQFYSAVRGEEGEATEVVNLSDRLVLEGTPPGAVPEGGRWVADLPWELRERLEYVHLFPGRLEGFRGAVTERLAAMDGVEAYDQTTWTVYTTVGGSLKEMVKAGYLKSPPWSISGLNLRAATEEWHRLMANYVDTLSSLRKTHPCPRCGGTGDAPTQEPDAAKVSRVAERFRKYAGRSTSLSRHASRLAEIAVRELG